MQPIQVIPGSIPTRADRGRDALAVVALLVSLALDWNADGIAVLRVDVAVVTLMSFVSLGLPAASRRGLFGSGWTPAKLRLTKMLIGVPYIVLVAVYLGWDVVSRWTEWDYGSTGLGPAVWIGLAGAVLAAQPRQSDLFDIAPSDTDRTRAQSRTVLLALGVLFAIDAVSAAAISLYRFTDGLDGIAGVRVGVLDPVVAALVALAWLGIVGRLLLAAAAGRVGAGLSLSLLGWSAASWALTVSIPGAPFESVDTVQLTYLGVGLLGGIGAAASAPALWAPPALTQRDYYWSPLGLVMAVATLWVALSVVRLTLYSASTATLGAMMFFTIAIAGATLVRDRLAGSDVSQRGALITLAAGLFGVGLAVLIVMGVRINWNYPAPMALWLIGIVVPAFIGWRESTVARPGRAAPGPAPGPDGFVHWVPVSPGPQGPGDGMVR